MEQRPENGQAEPVGATALIFFFFQQRTRAIAGTKIMKTATEAGPGFQTGSAVTKRCLSVHGSGTASDRKLPWFGKVRRAAPVLSAAEQSLGRANHINAEEPDIIMSRWTVQPAEVLRRYKVIAVVGASKNPEKEAFTVPLYLKQHGYTVIPVNPNTDSIQGEKAYPNLAGIPRELAGTIDVVEVFRPSEELPDVATQVVQMKGRTGRPFVFWAQLGLENDDAKKILLAGGVDFVMDACMRTQHRLTGGPR